MARPPIPPRDDPRLSANDFALYMVSSDTARLGILRRAKYPQTPPLIRYRDVRGPVCQYLADPLRNLNVLVAAEQMFRQRIEDPASSPLMRDDAVHSIEVIAAVQRMRNQLAGFDFIGAPANQGRLVVNGVEISVRADLLVHGSARGIDQIGAAVLRMTAAEAANETAIERRRNMGLYVATLARRHVDENIQTNRQPQNRLCMSIDIQHGEVFQAPNANTRRMNDIESACVAIAAVWPRL